MTRFKLALLTCGVSVGALCAGTAIAQSTVPAASSSNVAEQGAASNSGLAEIIVTANKRSENINTVPISIVAASSEQLAAAGVTNTSDLVKIVPGFTAQRSFAGAPSFSLRGVGFADVTIGAVPSVSTYIDQAALPFSVMTQGALLDMERVEVLKGPQGILFGQNSTGGAINFIARKPTETFEAGIKAGYSRFNTVEAEAYLSGPLSETLSARLAVGGTHSDNLQRRYTASGGSGRQRKLAARLQLNWAPSPSVRFLLNANGWIDNSNPLSPQFYRAQPTVPATALPELLTYPTAPRTNHAADFTDWDTVQFTDPDHDSYLNRQRFGQITLRGDFDLSDSTTFTSMTNYIRMHYEHISDADGTIYNINSTGQRSDIKSFGQELRLSTQPMDGVRLLIGGNYQKDIAPENNINYYDHLSTAFSQGPDLAFHSNFNKIYQSHRTLAAFTNVDYELSSTLQFSAGVRFTRVKHILRDACTGDTGDGGLANFFNSLLGAPGFFEPGGCTVLNASFQQAGETEDSFSEKNWSWRGNLSWTPSPNALLYASVSRGFKSGSYINTGVTSSDQYTQPVRQERLTAFEVGSKLGLFDRRLQLNAAAFYYDYKDKQLVGPYVNEIFGRLTALINIPKSRVYGFEVDATAKPFDGFTIRGSVNYTDTKIKNSQAPFVLTNINNTEVDVRGGRFNFAPKWNASADAEYEWNLSTKMNAFLGASGLFNSATNAYLANGYSNSALVDPSAREYTRIKRYATLDLRAGLRGAEDDWELSVWGRNVTNTWYWSNVQNPGDTLVRFTGMPVTYGITLNFKYR